MTIANRAPVRWAVVGVAVYSCILTAQHGHPSSIDDIRTAALDDSEAMQHLFELTDSFGPRNVGSPGLKASREWLLDQLKQYGLRDVHTEQNPPIEIGPETTWNPGGWSWTRMVVQQITPWPATLTAVPALYSPATHGIAAGETVFAPLPKPEQAAVDAFMERYRGKLRGRIILLQDRESAIPRSDGPLYHRYSDDEMTAFGLSPKPIIRSPAQTDLRHAPQPDPKPVAAFRSRLSTQSSLFRFLKDEGVLAMIEPARGEGGTLFLHPPLAPPDLVEAPPPIIELAPEHFNRLVRLMKRSIAVRLEINLQSEVTNSRGTENVIAEIPGSDKRGEVVLVGAHLDSWHGSVGATDNAVNVAVVLEAARILEKLKTPLRRTVRFAFWDGEEMGEIGSRGYVAGHLVDPRSGQRRPEHGNLSCYFNLDYGAGRIRGVYLQGRTELRPILQSWLDTLDEGRLVASPQSTLGSDQASFERIGIPGISFIQDPLNYEIRSHHTNMDNPDYVLPEDLKHSVNVLTQLVYYTAMADGMLPREEPGSSPK